MTPKEIAASLATVVIVSAIVVGYASKQEPYQFVKTPIAATRIVSQKTYDARQKRLSGSLLGVKNGVKTYFVLVQTDAGAQRRVIAGPTHARRNPKIGPSCHMRQPDGGIRDQGDFNRFPAGLAVGADCQLVSQMVYLGQDAESDQDITRKR